MHETTREKKRKNMWLNHNIERIQSGQPSPLCEVSYNSEVFGPMLRKPLLKLIGNRKIGNCENK